MQPRKSHRGSFVGDPVSPPVIDNKWVRLEVLAARHRDAMQAVAADPDLWRFHYQNQYGKTFDHWLDLYCQGTDDGDICCFAVFDVATGQLAGSSTFLAISAPFKRLEIGSTWYAKPFQGGVTNPATKLAMMTHVFETLGWRRVEFKLDADNKRSWAAMKKLGATEEGIFRKHMILPDGKNRDSVWFSVIDDDWPRVKAGLMQRLER